ncbi:hypothetical protein Back2_12720 [Nocardioides baekrokdamisoli]|uniref:PBP domain-containing protein n=1 Tax=Nocardioides baekrokdamisoli TaxID=1804624 RepID=A0A3G9ILU4_9ACTN|nr:hypothetical protein [Nocardioides baekrokdamisoli]BBH16985.1 hypothetical protein Back2_12720 [Nocardioides baekrokdamisoli]
MKHSKKFLAGGAAVLASVALATPAFADPVRPYVAAGSDTIQDVWNGLTNDSTAVAPSIASWNATSGGVAYNTIQTKTGGAWFARPNGSGDGLKAVCATWDAAGDPTNKLTLNSTNYTLNTQDVDFGRSSSGPAGTSGTVQYLPFARDAVSIAYNTQAVGAAASGLPASLNLATTDITALYSGVPSADGRVTFTQADGSAEPSGNATADATAKVFLDGLQVVPVLPQTASGTRKFFAGAAGISNSQGANAAYVSDLAGTVFGAGTAGPYEENNGRALTIPGAIIPFSAAQWISQQTAAAPNTLDNSKMAIASVNGSAAVTGSGSSAAQGPLFGSQNAAGAFNTVPVSGVGNFNRDTYDVVPGGFLPTGTPTPKQSALVSILTGGGIGQIFSGAGKTIIKKFGFGVLSYSVGTGSALPGDCPSGY